MGRQTNRFNKIEGITVPEFKKKDQIYIRHPFVFEPLPEALLIRRRQKEGKKVNPYFFKDKPLFEKE